MCTEYPNDNIAPLFKTVPKILISDVFYAQAPSAGCKTRLESSIKRLKPHLIYDLYFSRFLNRNTMSGCKTKPVWHHSVQQSLGIQRDFERVRALLGLTTWMSDSELQSVAAVPAHLNQ